MTFRKTLGVACVFALCHPSTADAQAPATPARPYVGVTAGIGAMSGHIGEAVSGVARVPTVVGSIGGPAQNRISVEAEIGWAGRISRNYSYKQTYLNTVNHFHVVGLLRASSPMPGMFDDVDLVGGLGIAVRDFTSGFSGDTRKMRPQFEFGIDATKWTGRTGLVLGARVVVVPNVGGWPRTPEVLFLAGGGVRGRF